jgi:MoaA/NifB/PqqE/SkfB family radical SAM enzyme
MVRIDTKANYKGVFFNGKTIRQRINPTLPILAPEFAEIEDVAINSKCFANCPYCYTSATKSGSNFENIIEKADGIWGSVDQNSRPFQIAIGGAGESTIHPDWSSFVKKVRELGIVPNYTTNGMHLSKKILKATSDYCGGVAVSYHPHIPNVFSDSIEKLHTLRNSGVKLNCHLIVGDNKSLEDAKEIFSIHKDKIDFFVILPYQAAGRGSFVDTDMTWKNLFIWIHSLSENERSKFAFGALFYEWMLINEIPLKIEIYEPEIYSGYRIFDSSYRTLRKSSYNLEPKK